MGKRKREAIPTPPAESVEEWLATFLKMPGDEQLLNCLASIANRADIKTAEIKRAMATLPLVSATNWSNFAERVGLADSLENNVFERVITPVYSLPLSVHVDMFEAAWRSQDVYREKMEQKSDLATTLRVMDPVRDLLYFLQSF